jgi:predicted  nucleic acid-binding Zn-ribbon protein
MKVFVMVLLAVGACVFGYLWLDTGRKAERDGTVYRETITELQDAATVQTTKLEETQAANIWLNQDVKNLEEQIQIAVATLSSTSNQVSALEAQVVEAGEAARKATAEIAVRDQKIAKLEVERDDLTGKMSSLNEKIVQLEGQIGSAETQLAAARGDRSFLLKELTRMQAEKAELERQFTDLAVLRDQVNRLQNELAVARRVDMIRAGGYAGQQLKGAGLLHSKQFKQAPEVAPRSYDLDVEIKADGSSAVVTTNRPSVRVTPLNP